ncbi:hypothetical protein NUW54_g10789 [Trametes sanguinea]|uniref:Uncharacterized protein n=1 Tax=Trametes sanguinea TaxID=158606 RepID=A0ACC1NTF1_9APHY|nr:hypothetical protein NUW54_g10789 [Trametes sanguinea]
MNGATSESDAQEGQPSKDKQARSLLPSSDLHRALEISVSAARPTRVALCTPIRLPLLPFLTCQQWAGARKTSKDDPSPLLDAQENGSRPSQKKLGKRKADDVETTAKRPAKKPRESEGKAAKPPAAKGKEKGAAKGALKSKSDKPKPKKQKQARFEDEDEGAGSSEGWEDVEDDEDLQAQAKSLFHNSDDEEFAGFEGDLNDLDADEMDQDDDMFRGPVQELDLGSDDEDEPELPIKGKKSKQHERPLKIIPTGSDASSDDSDEDDEDEDGPITIKNMEARQAELAGAESDDDLADLDDVDMDEEGEGNEEGEEGFVLPTAEELEEEKKRGGPDVHTVQRRMRECVRVLGNFKRYAAKGRSRSEYVQTLISDIASYYGYNEFLAEKLFQLFPVAEVRCSGPRLRFLLLIVYHLRLLSSSRQMRFLGQ